MQFNVETEQESDGRWIAEVTEIPGILKYGQTRKEAIGQAEALAFRVIKHADTATKEPRRSRKKVSAGAKKTDG